MTHCSARSPRASAAATASPDTPRRRCPGGASQTRRLLGRERQRLGLIALRLELRERLEHQGADRFLRRRVADRAQQREGAALPVDGEAAGRERDAAAAARLALPDREADE